MAKFAVGEIVYLLCAPKSDKDAWGRIHGYRMGIAVEILALPGYTVCPCCGASRVEFKPESYSVKAQGLRCYGVPENALGRLPPDDHADDTTEDPGLTRIKKLLKHETAPHKKPITTPETET